MYDISGLSSQAKFMLEYSIYAGISQEIKSIQSYIELRGMDDIIQVKVSAVTELVSWYCDTVVLSGKYLKEELQKLQQVICIKSNR